MNINAHPQIVIIGYSNVALRLAYRLSQTQIAVRFYITPAEESLIYNCPDMLELAYLPRLSPHYLPEAVSTATTVVLASDDEAFNLHATMHLKSQYPDLKILTRSFNLAIGQEIEQRLSQVKVFSVSDRGLRLILQQQPFTMKSARPGIKINNSVSNKQQRTMKIAKRFTLKPKIFTTMGHT